MFCFLPFCLLYRYVSVFFQVNLISHYTKTYFIAQHLPQFFNPVLDLSVKKACRQSIVRLGMHQVENEAFNEYSKCSTQMIRKMLAYERSELICSKGRMASHDHDECCYSLKPKTILENAINYQVDLSLIAPAHPIVLPTAPISWQSNSLWPAASITPGDIIANRW